MEKAEIIICSGCIEKNIQADTDLEALLTEVETQLYIKRPDIEWNLNSQSCFRFCPEGRITVSVSEKMTMTRKASVEAIVNEILSFYKK